MAAVVKRASMYLARAEELKVHKPVVSYYCRMWAIDVLAKAHGAGESAPEVTNLLMAELTKAEEAKKTLDLVNGRDEMEAFAVNIFNNVDQTDRAGQATAQTPQDFFIAVIFMEVCAQFYDGELPPDIAEKVRYAKYRIQTIRNCLRQGVPIEPPPSAAGEAGASAAAAAAPASAAPAPAPAAAPIDVPTPAAAAAAAAAPAPAAPPRAAVPLGGTSKADLKKKIQFASSALDFRDVEGAKMFLHQALQILDAQGVR
mmetsp:Transcript_116817/g.202716  ORF Transcript_116817/g.202716 Transcript_116817/m.202716 type:complete len:257 (+) Transcript_116817:106-876(+)